MQAVANSLGLQHSYRHGGPSQHQAALPHLGEAADALHVALLTLDAPADVGRRTQLARIANARQFLVDAVTSLARARVHVSGVRTYAVNVVTHGDQNPQLELTRLRDLLTTLLWHNHGFLPAQQASMPLAPEDEAQLAEVTRELANHAKIDRVMRYKWLVAGAMAGLLAPALGVALYAVAAVSGGLAAVELARAQPACS